MALPTTFNTLPAVGTTVPATAAQLDGDLNAVGAMAVTQCIAAGTNAITLTPLANQPSITGYVNGQLFSFVPTATSTGAVTAQINALPFIQVFLPSAVQAGTGAGNLIVGNPYLVMFLSALNAGAGGFIVVSQSAGLSLPQSYLAGLTLSNDGASPNTVLDIAAGTCDDSTHVVTITLAAFTKTTGGAWVAGAGQPGMGVGLTIANTTWYHVFAIQNAGLPDVYFDTSVTAANKPAGTTQFRRIGSVLTDGAAHIIVFQQNGDYFRWTTPPLDGNNVATTPAYANLTISVPLGVVVEAFGNTNATGGFPVQIRPPFALDGVVTNSTSPLGTVAPSSTLFAGGKWFSRTNASSQVQWASSSNSNSYLTTEGWIDYRGKNL